MESYSSISWFAKKFFFLSGMELSLIMHQICMIFQKSASISLILLCTVIGIEKVWMMGMVLIIIPRNHHWVQKAMGFIKAQISLLYVA